MPAASVALAWLNPVAAVAHARIETSAVRTIRPDCVLSRRARALVGGGGRGGKAGGGGGLTMRRS
jgi:hypothetical protein